MKNCFTLFFMIILNSFTVLANDVPLNDPKGSNLKLSNSLSEFPKFLAGEKLNGDLILASDFLRDHNLSIYKKEALFRGLMRFFINTWELESIGDFNLSNLSWNGSDWVLVNWSHKQVRFDLDTGDINRTVVDDVLWKSDLGKLYFSDLQKVKNKIIDRRKNCFLWLID